MSNELIRTNLRRILPLSCDVVEPVSQQHDWSLGSRLSIVSRRAVNEPNSMLGVTGDTVGGSTLVVRGGVVGDGGSVTTVVLFTTVVVDASSGGFVPTTRTMPCLQFPIEIYNK